jgi:hypothetical protein
MASFLVMVVAFSGVHSSWAGHLVAALAAVWFGSEALLARAAGWHLSLASPLAWALRDTLLPFTWVHAWLTNALEDGRMERLTGRHYAPARARRSSDRGRPRSR